MPIRIWNEPGGPVRYGYDWTDLEDTLSDEMKQRLGIEQTPLGRLVSREDVGPAVLDMTQPGNVQARERIMSQRSPFEGLSRQRVSEAIALANQGLTPDEMTAMRLSRPRFETNVLDVGGREYPMTEMIEPSAQDLSRSAALWKISGVPLEQALTGAEAEKESGLGRLYSAQAESYGTSEQQSFDEFVKLISPALQGMDEEQKRRFIEWAWEAQMTGKFPEEPEAEVSTTGTYLKEPGFFGRLYQSIFGGKIRPPEDTQSDEEFLRQRVGG